MQRNSADYQTLTGVILPFAGLFIYGSVVTMFPYLPPLFGFLIALMVATRSKYLVPVLIYFIIFESEHNLFIFSTWIFLYFFMKFILPILEENLACRKCILALCVILGYLVFYLMMFIFYFLLGQHFFNIDPFLLTLYIFLEIIIAVVIL